MNQKLKLSILVTLILLITSFLPVLQVIVMVFNGGFLSLFVKEYSIVIDIIKYSIVINLINLFLSILFIILFSYAKRKKNMIMFTLGFVFFFFPFLSFAFEKIIPENPYFLMPLINGILIGLALFLAGVRDVPEVYSER